MSQINVERVIGLLATDEALRRQFRADPLAALAEMVEGGMELTSSEFRSLASLNPRELARFAHAIDSRLQKSDLHGSAT
jgi:hypothetical protein